MHTLQISLWVVVLLVALAILFDFMNGFHDAANSIATVVSTGVLKPQQAVAMAAACNVIAIFIFHLKVATTVGRDTIDPSIVDHYVIFGALVGAIAWNIVTWYYGIPSSSSHALIGGLVGSGRGQVGHGLAGGQRSAEDGGVHPDFAAAGVHPRLLPDDRGVLAVLPHAAFQGGPLVPAAAVAVGVAVQLGPRRQRCAEDHRHHLDAADRRGYASATASTPPIWVIVCCYVAIGMGTLLGGWRIVRTMGQKITKLKPVGGFCAETGGALTLFFASALGVPVSTTHTITGAIVGVGAAQKASAVRWGVAGNIVWAWVLTIPASAFMAAIAWWIGRQLL